MCERSCEGVNPSTQLLVSLTLDVSEAGEGTPATYRYELPYGYRLVSIIERDIQGHEDVSVTVSTWPEGLASSVEERYDPKRSYFTVDTTRVPDPGNYVAFQLLIERGCTPSGTVNALVGPV